MTIYKGRLENEETGDVFYPQTSYDMVEGAPAPGDYLPKVNPTLPASSQLRGTKVDGSTIPLISLWQMLNEQEFVMLGTSAMPIGFVVADDETRPIVVRTGSISDYVAFQSDIPEVVNNLTTDDAKNALSAKQGLFLQQTKRGKINYSNAEILTGESLLNKPIYSRTIVKDSDIGDQNDLVFNDMPNVDDIWIDVSNSFLKASQHWFPIPKTSLNANTMQQHTEALIETFIIPYAAGNAYTVRVECGNGIVSEIINKIVVTVKYTKTTD
ncbi:hypothetical protein [Thomasclavelia spiroformis]|uniref:hypothetical protein n=1 Tax=Thomasclavelia spiroformis TaxID=29348 RepID=UPI003208EA2C